MSRKLYIGTADFVEIREGGYFYVDKTAFLREWWEGKSYAGINKVTLVTRPRRFGKSLMQSTVEAFFSPEYAGRNDLFKGLKIWRYKKYRTLQGTIPVISLSFGNIKSSSFTAAVPKFAACMIDLYKKFFFLLASEKLTDADRSSFKAVAKGMDLTDIGLALRRLCEMVHTHFGKKPIILLDEYDTPLQAAWVKGYWEEMADFLRDMFDSTFKENTHLERSLLTGITLVSQKSLFSGLNNVDVISTTSEQYAADFGFTEKEVLQSMKEYNLKDIAGVRSKYDGFIFGNTTKIYNPWSITKYLFERKFDTYWANTSSNDLVDMLVRNGKVSVKTNMEKLLHGEVIESTIDEQVVYSQLFKNTEAVWSLLLASGYIKVESRDLDTNVYHLKLTNGEVLKMMENIIARWFSDDEEYELFEKALFSRDIKLLNTIMNKFSVEMFSSFDTGKGKAGNEPERFYHGFVLGLLVKTKKRYVVTSNRESGYGRYDVMLIPRNPDADPAVIIEFKVQDEADEKSLNDTVAVALRQIEDRHYAADLIARGIPEANILKYGFAFHGKTVLIG